MKFSVSRAACLILVTACALNGVSLDVFSASPDLAYAHAESLIRQHRWDEGLAVLQPLLRSHPTDPKTLNLAGLAYTGKGDRRHADAFFSAALKSDPGFVPARKNLAISQVQSGDIAAARRNLLLASQQSPDDPVINTYLGDIYYREQQYQSSVDAFSRAFAVLHRDPNLVAHLAIGYLKIGRTKDAMHTLDSISPSDLSPESQFVLGVTLAQSDLSTAAVPYFEAVWQRSASYDAGYNLALCYLATKRYSQTIATLNTLIRQGHETAELDNVLAEGYAGNEEIQPAVDALRRAIALDPQDENNYMDFASLCINNNAFKEASQVLSVGLSVHPRSSRLVLERGILNTLQGHYDLAEKDFEESSDLAPETNSGYVALGLTYLQTGDKTQAISLLRKRLLETPNDANLLYLLGEALERSSAPGEKEFAEAQRVLEKSVRLNSQMCLPHISLGKIYQLEGKLQDAVTQFEQARLIDPREKSGYSHLAVAYRRLGQFDKASAAVNALKAINDQERENPAHGMKSVDETSRASLPNDFK